MPWSTDKFRRVLLLLLLACSLVASAIPTPEQWIPIRWTGGPLELPWRAHTKTPPTDVSIRDTSLTGMTPRR